MGRRIWGWMIVLLIGASGLGTAAAQDHVFVPVGDWTYDYIERLQRRGHLLQLNPTALPYTRGDIRAALRGTHEKRLRGVERAWFERLERHFSERKRRRSERHGHDATVGMDFDAGLRAANGERLDVLRPDAAVDPTLAAGDIHLYPNASLHGFVERGRVVAHAGLRFDVYYRDDPDGLDAANRLITRNDASYVGYDGEFASVYLGRIGRHWALPTQPGLLVSDNAVSMDQVAFRVGGERLAWRGMLGELDSATSDGRFTGTAGADSVGGSIRRYLASHRVDWRPSKRVVLSVMESALYSGRNAGPSVKFLNPLLIHLFSIDGRPKNDENNGLVAALLWAQAGDWTLSGQLMLDDFDVLGESGEPLSAAVTGSLVYAGLSATDVRISATAVTARAYNTHQPEGRYVYLNRGIGTAFSDFVHASASAALYLDEHVPGLAISPKIDLLLQGQRDFRQAYPMSDADAILNGTVERTLRPAVEIAVHPSPHWWARLDVGANLTSNAAHVEDVDDSRFTFLVEFGARIRLDQPLKLSF